MTNEKTFKDKCPICCVEMQRRKRDIGKNCKFCSMSKIGFAHGEFRRANPTGKTQKENSQNSRKARILKDPFKFRMQRTFDSCRHRAKQNNVPFEITLQDLIDMFPFDNLCPILNFPFIWGTQSSKELSPSVDRMIPSKGYVKGNINFISYKANRIKSDSTLEILEKIIKYMKA